MKFDEPMTPGQKWLKELLSEKVSKESFDALQAQFLRLHKEAELLSGELHREIQEDDLVFPGNAFYRLQELDAAIAGTQRRDVLTEAAKHVAERNRELTKRVAQLENELNAVRRNAALESVLEERVRQDTKWGEQNHNPYIYLSILMEEVGELSQAILQSQFGGEHGGERNVRKEAVHTAAVALAIVECLDRGLWRDDDVRLSDALLGRMNQ